MKQTIKQIALAALLAGSTFATMSAFPNAASAQIGHSAPQATPNTVMQTQTALPEVQYDAYGESLKSVGKETVVLYTTPDCAECKKAEDQLLRLSEKFPGLNFVKIDGNVRYRPDQLPVLDIVTTELLWVYTKQRYDWNDAKLTAFLSEREMYADKEYTLFGTELSAQKSITSTIAANSGLLELQQGKIASWNEVYEHSIQNLAADSLQRLVDLDKERSAASPARQAEIERKELALIANISSEYQELVAAKSKHVQPLQETIDSIQKAAAAKFLSEQETTHKQRWNAIMADRQAAKAFDRP